MKHLLLSTLTISILIAKLASCELGMAWGCFSKSKKPPKPATEAKVTVTASTKSKRSTGCLCCGSTSKSKTKLANKTNVPTTNTSPQTCCQYSSDEEIMMSPQGQGGVSVDQILEISRINQSFGDASFMAAANQQQKN